MSLVVVSDPKRFTTFEGKADQAEGCLVKIKSFPLPATKTEISLDIGSPSFHYVEHKKKVIRFAGIARGRYPLAHIYNKA
ncbi:hypothetical protein ASF29_22115 [Rhizobium sp. Leaf262]|nr:hypothetical protein ASF29_22115 [Rhizobium sp. Leaf262]